MKRIPPLLFFLTFFASAFLVAQTAQHRPGEFLVSLAEGADALGLARRFDSASSAEKISRLLNVWLLRSQLPEQEMLAWLRQQPEVRTAQFNHLLENRGGASPDLTMPNFSGLPNLQILPDDPHFPQQWHLFNDGSSGGVFDADLDAEQAWDIATGGLTQAGDTIVLAVIDGGVYADHPDLAPNLWHNWADIPDNGLDDDQNGYADDFRGWNTFAENDDIQGNATEHGTAVSNILGARGDNGIGATGVNWNTKIMFVAASGTEAEVLAAYDYVLQARRRYNATWGASGAFVVAVNCSWGTNYGQPSEAPLWCAAFDSLGAVGIVSVAATANLPVNVDEVGDLPTACPSDFLISVTSLDRSDLKAENAAWGAQHVDLGAYGQEVFTAVSGNGYGYFSGTSFAAPQVAGAIGLLYAVLCPNLIGLAKIEPAAAAHWAKNLVVENVTPNPSLANKTGSGGRLNLYKALRAYTNQCSTCPAPFALKSEKLTAVSAMLHWFEPPVAVSANLRWRVLGMGTWNEETAVLDSFLLTGLNACTSYEFEMQSVCDKGVASAWSPPFIFQTKGCCIAPTSIWLESSTENSARIAWEVSGFNDSCRLRVRPQGASGWAFFETDTNFWAFQNLLPCTFYEAQVQSHCDGWLTDFSPIFLFQTKGCGACNEVAYCSAASSEAIEEWIEWVQIGPWLHVSGAGGNGYQNFGGDQPILPLLTSQSTVSVAVAPGFSGSVSKEYFRIFVDFNQDGDFDDADELAFDPGFALEGTANGLLQVPTLAAPGITRLRVMMKFTTPNDDPPMPCTDFEFGQVEDYCAELRLDSLHTSIAAEDTVWVLRAYPQPAHDAVLLEFPEGVSKTDCALWAVDMRGRTVMDFTAPVLRNSKVFLDVSLWPAGIYALQARCGGKLMRG
ncbi:MAG: S8 family serine peptidase, partial [Saprospiraceae bacterium]